MLAQRKRICGKEQNLNGGLQNWLSTLQRSPFFRHHFSKSTALFPRLLCVGRMRVDMHDNVRWGPGGTRGYATTVFTTSCQSWASSSDKHANSSSTPTLPLPAVTTFRLLRNSCFAWSFLQILPFSPCSTCNSQASWRNWLWWWWWRWVTRALPYWRLVKRSWANKKEKKPVQRWKIVSKPATCKFTPFLRRCRVACESERHSTQESGRHLLKKNAKWRLKRLRPLWPLHRTRRWLATSCDRYCRTANQRSLIVKKTLFKYATSFHEMENFPWCASPRAFQRYQIWEASPMLIKMTNALKCGQLCCCARYLKSTPRRPPHQRWHISMLWPSSATSAFLPAISPLWKCTFWFLCACVTPCFFLFSFADLSFVNFFLSSS